MSISVRYLCFTDIIFLRWFAEEDNTETGRMIWKVEHSPLPVIIIEFYDDTWFIGFYCDLSVKYNGACRDGFMEVEKDLNEHSVLDAVKRLWRTHADSCISAVNEFKDIVEKAFNKEDK